MSTVAPIREPQINQNIYVGQSSVKTIQAAVASAVQQGGGFVVIIPAGYVGSDTIASVTGGSANVYLCDQRTASPQCYTWSGTAYVPADFTQLGFVQFAGDFNVTGGATVGSLDVQFGAVIGVNLEVEGNGEFSGGLDIAQGVILTGPVPTDQQGSMQMGYSPAGSGGNGSGNILVTSNTGTGAPGLNLQMQSADGTLPFHTYLRCDVDSTNTPRLQLEENTIITGDLDVSADLTAATCEVGGSPVRTMANTPDSLPMPPAGVPVSTGTAWSGSIPAATFAMLPNANLWPNQQTFTAMIVANGGINAPGGIGGSTLVLSGLAELSDFTAGNGALNSCTVGGSPVRTMANTPNAAPYPPAGVPQSTGTAWGASIVASTIALLPNANLWPNEQTFGVQINAQGGLYSASGDVNVGGDLIGGGLTASTGDSSSPGTTSIRTLPGTGVAISADTAASTIYLNWDRGVGVEFGNGNQMAVAAVDTNGYMSAVSFDAVDPNAMTYVGAIEGQGVSLAKGNSVWCDNYGNFHCVAIQSWTLAANDGSFTGTLTAVTKNFKIVNPFDPTTWLVHGSLEGPENGVYYRGEDVTDSDGNAEIALPDYFEALTTPEGRTVLLTQLFEDDSADFAQLMAGRVVNGKFRVRSSVPAIKFCWMVNAVRADVAPLQVVQEKELSAEHQPDQPTNPPGPQPPTPPQTTPQTTQPKGKRRV
jgi:hypothetical protein